MALNKDDLTTILEKHKKWLNKEEGGERADLRGANLLEANLQGANLLGANLLGANLRGADLRRANLRRADLQGADLRGANLRETFLQGADLRGVYLQGTINKEICTISNIGTYKGNAVYIPEIDTVFAGCWSGSLERFLKKGGEMNKYDEKELKKIELAYEFFKIHKEE